MALIQVRDRPFEGSEAEGWEERVGEVLVVESRPGCVGPGREAWI